MRIDSLELINFRGFEKKSFKLDPHFTLFIGDNGSGKTSVLDGLAVAAAIWLVDPPDSKLAGSRREILVPEIRLEADTRGDRIQFREKRPVRINASGCIGGHNDISWTRQIRLDGRRTTNAEAKAALSIIKDIYRRDDAGEDVLCPVLAYYGAGRAWLPSNLQKEREGVRGPARRWSAFYDCFNERIRFGELNSWFRKETIERGNLGGQWRNGWGVVAQAVLRCLPGADAIYFDADRDEVVIEVKGSKQPFSNLSAGQRMMAALVADLAIKIVTQNAFLVPKNGPLASDALPQVLAETPGLVLIDELDVHLHPSWQRHIVTDLRSTFPSIQFVCTSHSPQIIGEIPSEQVRVLHDDDVSAPPASFGLDSNRVLEEIMDAPSRNESIRISLQKTFDLIELDQFDQARNQIAALAEQIGADDPELNRAKALITFLESDL